METKRCPDCSQDLSVELFNWRDKKKGKRQSYCKSCQMARTMAHYNTNSGPYIERNRRAREKIDKFVLRYLLDHPCACGESDPVLLDFDHEDPKTKVNCISRMKHVSFSALKEEIEKCTVKCVKCHRKRTALQNGQQAKINRWIDEIKNGNLTIYAGMPRVNAAKELPCKKCGKLFKDNGRNQFCSLTCSGLANRKVERPPKGELEIELSRNTWHGTAGKYGVTSNAVVCWAKTYGIVKKRVCGRA